MPRSSTLNKMQDFLLLEEKELQVDTVAVKKTEKVPGESVATTVELDYVSGKWNKEESELTLDEISLTASSGKLVAIIGPVGSGKSSIIQAVLGEFPISQGSVNINGTISYSPQEAWVFSGTVRQNILFGMEFDEKRYWRVIEACALKHDFAQWEYGDRTLVGERGVSLSGNSYI